jgi:hypothetical protein
MEQPKNAESTRKFLQKNEQVFWRVENGKLNKKIKIVRSFMCKRFT